MGKPSAEETVTLIFVLGDELVSVSRVSTLKRTQHRLLFPEAQLFFCDSENVHFSLLEFS
jgi:hypothetical protein